MGKNVKGILSNANAFDEYTCFGNNEWVNVKTPWHLKEL